MPTYVVYFSGDSLSAPAKKALANVITRAHCGDSKIPYYLCQVIFHSIKSAYHFINGEAIDGAQIWIRGDVRSGRTDDQKTRIITQIVQEGSKATGISQSRFWVYICDIPKMAEFGRIMPGPGAEESWIASLPVEVLSRFNSLSP